MEKDVEKEEHHDNHDHHGGEKKKMLRIRLICLPILFEIDIRF